MAGELSISNPYHPTDPETGAELPMTRTFTVENVGYGIVSVYHRSHAELAELAEAQGGMLRLGDAVAAIRATYTKPAANGETVLDDIWTDPHYTSLRVVCEDKLIIPALKQRFGI